MASALPYLPQPEVCSSRHSGLFSMHCLPAPILLQLLSSSLWGGLLHFHPTRRLHSTPEGIFSTLLPASAPRLWHHFGSPVAWPLPSQFEAQPKSAIPSTHSSFLLTQGTIVCCTLCSECWSCRGDEVRGQSCHSIQAGTPGMYNSQAHDRCRAHRGQHKQGCTTCDPADGCLWQVLCSLNSELPPSAQTHPMPPS